MSEIMNQVWDTVINLPEEKQELIAHMILDEIEDDKEWDGQFQKSANQLKSIAQKVRNDIIAKNYREKGFGEM